MGNADRSAIVAALLKPLARKILAVAPDEKFLAGDLELLRRCDGAVCVEGWMDSAGSRGEVELCNREGIPVVEWRDVVRGKTKVRTR